MPRPPIFGLHTCSDRFPKTFCGKRRAGRLSLSFHRTNFYLLGGNDTDGRKAIQQALFWQATGVLCPLTTMTKERSIPGTHESFTSLLSALGGSPAAAGQHYEQLRAKLIFFFTRKALEVPEDLADEVLDRIGRRLSEGVAILSVDGFALGVARHVAQEQIAKRNRVESVDPAFFHNVPAVSTTFSEDSRLVYLERCLRRLPSFDSQLLKGYYLSGGGAISARKNMAERLGISPGTLRQKVFLIRRRLLECVTARLEKRKSE